MQQGKMRSFYGCSSKKSTPIISEEPHLSLSDDELVPGVSILLFIKRVPCNNDQPVWISRLIRLDHESENMT